MAIVDFDVHHGNGTEACVEGLVPRTVRKDLSTAFADIAVKDYTYKPWLGEVRKRLFQRA